MDRFEVATQEHVDYLAPRLRQDDQNEIEAFVGMDPLTALTLSREGSVFAWTWLVNDNPVAMFGVSSQSLIGDTGMPWLLATDAVWASRRMFMKHSRIWLAYLLELFPNLVNFVDHRYTACIRWLKRLGFEVMEAEPMGPYGMPFHRFEIRKSPCV